MMKKRELYHVGFLCNDREYDEQVDDIAKRMMQRQRDGTANLVQKKLGKGEYEYWAYRAK